MSFDKNRFKEAFRVWVNAHPAASSAQVLEFCHCNIPPQHMLKNYWLVEQSLQWFQWLSEQKDRSQVRVEDLESDDLDSQTLH